MARKPKGLVFDAWAILAYFEGHEAGERVVDLISDAHTNETALWMTVANAGEVWYTLARATSASEADTSINELQQIGIQLVEVDWKLAREAALLKTRYHLSFADSIAAALARQLKAELVTGDSDFRKAEQEIKMVWLQK